MQGRRERWGVVCDGNDCGSGPLACSEKMAVEYWNQVAWWRPSTLSPLAESKNLVTSATANAAQAVALTGNADAESGDASGELGFAGGDSLFS